MARGGQRVAAIKGHASLNQLQQLQLQFSPSGELKAVTQAKTFRISDCAGNWDDYGRGSILRIRLINFQKYSDCIIRPGPFMNMIIGPNGTGKSTIVAAVALGLGANPGVLGRSKNVAEFIKYQASSASIEIVLKSSEAQFITIRRVFRRTAEQECESDWFINGNLSNQRAVLQCAQEMGVQIGNLCQFLPQDRVSDFALMTPEQMLMATMAAAAPEETLNQFNELIQLKREERTLMAALKKDQGELSNNQRVLSTLQTLKQRAQERDERKRKLDLLRRKRPWLLYSEARKAYAELKIRRDELKVELEAAISETDQDLVNQIKDIEENLKRSSRKIRQLSNRVLSARTRALEMHQKVSAAGLKIAEKKQEILGVRGSVENRREAYEETRQALREIDEKMTRIQRELDGDDGSKDNSVESQRRDLNLKINVLERRKVESEMEEKQIKENGARLTGLERSLETRLQEKRSVRVRRLDNLKKMNPGIPAAMNWLEHNRASLKGPFSDPICLDLEIRDEKLAAALESVVSRSILLSFIFSNRDDHETFSRVCEENRWVVNSILIQNYQSSGSSSLPPSSRPWSQQDLLSLGFEGVLADVIEGPELSIWALHDLTKIHMIPFSRGDLGSVDIKRCEGTRNLVKFLIRDSFFEIRRSRYNENDVAVKSSPLKPNFLFAINSSESEIQDLQAKLDSVRAELKGENQKMTAVLSKMNSLASQLKTLNEQSEELLKVKNSHVVKKAELKKLQVNREGLKRTARDQLSFIQQNSDESGSLSELKELIRERGDLVLDLCAGLCKYHEMTKVAGSEVILSEVNETKLKWLKHLLELRQGQHENLKKQLDMMEERVFGAKLRAQEALKVAEMDEIDEETKEALNLITEDLGELDQLIRAEEAVLTISGSGDRFGPQDLDELERRSVSIQQLEERITSAQGTIDELRGRMDVIRGPWRRQVDEMISVISAKFEAFFSKISCTGRVSLGLPPSGDETDFDSFSLAIWVKFRAVEQLQRLTGQRQSGGEKSVSTILYLLSLQELSRAPFRVVDEINQGMDVENERKIHSIIVEAATASSRPAQYFLITPKLLTGLDYHEKMHILCIFNGPGVLKDE